MRTLCDNCGFEKSVAVKREATRWRHARLFFAPKALKWQAASTCSRITIQFKNMLYFLLGAEKSDAYQLALTDISQETLQQLYSLFILKVTLVLCQIWVSGRHILPRKCEPTQPNMCHQSVHVAHETFRQRVLNIPLPGGKAGTQSSY